MRQSRVPIAEKRATESKTKHNSSQQKVTAVGPRITRKNFSVNMANTRSSKENKTKEGAEGKNTEPAIEIDLKTPDQTVDEVEKKTTESTPMPNAEEQNQKSMEFSPIDTVEDLTGNTPETVKDESQAKKNIIHREDSDDGWNEVEKRSGGRTECRERQNIWNSFHDNNRGQPRR